MNKNYEHFHQVDKILKYQPCLFFFFFSFTFKILLMLKGRSAGCSEALAGSTAVVKGRIVGQACVKMF